MKFDEIKSKINFDLIEDFHMPYSRKKNTFEFQYNV